MSTRDILEVVLIFTIVLTGGLLIAAGTVREGRVSMLFDSLSSPMFANVSYLVDAAIILIVALLLLRRHSGHGNTLLFEMLEAVVVAFTSFFAFLMALALVASAYIAGGGVYAAAAALAIGMVALKDMFPRLKDVATIVSSMGVGLVLGFNLPFDFAIGMLFAVAIYDYIGVFRSSEMMGLAKAFSDNNMAFLLSVSDLEGVPEGKYSKKDVSDYMEYLKTKHSLDDSRYRKMLDQGRLPVACQVSLGEGDLGMPLMVLVCAYYTFQGAPLVSAAVFAGALVGITLTMAVLKFFKHPLPAIPPIAATVSMFTGVALIASGQAVRGMVGLTASYVPEILIVLGAAALLLDMVAVLRRAHPGAGKGNAGEDAEASKEED